MISISLQVSVCFYAWTDCMSYRREQNIACEQALCLGKNSARLKACSQASKIRRFNSFFDKQRNNIIRCIRK